MRIQSIVATTRNTSTAWTSRWMAWPAWSRSGDKACSLTTTRTTRCSWPIARKTACGPMAPSTGSAGRRTDVTSKLMWSRTEMESRPATAPAEATRSGLSGARLARNFVLLGGAEVFSKGVTILAFACLARVLGPADFGALEFALAVITILTLLVDCGLSPYGAREVGKDPGKTGAL